MKIGAEVFNVATMRIAATVDASATRATAATPTANVSGQKVKVRMCVVCPRKWVPALRLYNATPITAPAVAVRSSTTVDVRATRTTLITWWSVNSVVNHSVKEILVRMFDVIATLTV